MGTLTRLFLRGLATVLPITLTIYFVYWLGTSAEALCKGLVDLLGLKVYWPGMGIALAVSITCIVGLLSYNALARWLYGLGVAIVERIPMVKTIFRMVRDMTEFFTQRDKQHFGNVVLVRPVDNGPRMIGFVTREDISQLTGPDQAPGFVSVYLPFSYAFGGFMVVVPADHVETVEMSMEDALRFVVTAGIVTEDRKKVT